MALLLLLAASAHAGVRFYEGSGIVVGFGSSSLGTASTELVQRRTGLQAGLMVDLLSSYLRVELEYLQRGQYTTTDVVDEHGVLLGTLREDQWVDYVSLPITAHLIADLKPFGAFVSVGPRLDFLLAYSESNSMYLPQLRQSYFSPVNIGANWGVGAVIPIRNVKIIPELRLTHTFNDAYRAASASLHPTSVEAVVAIRL
jgi:hypothetical protein